jgi:hypothetical protein
MKIRKNLAISDTGFMFDPSTGNSFSANPTGLAILQLLKSEKSEDAIVDSITEEFEVDRMQAERDVRDFLMLLQKFRLNNGE